MLTPILHVENSKAMEMPLYKHLYIGAAQSNFWPKYPAIIILYNQAEIVIDQVTCHQLNNDTMMFF